jgi:tRNA nucleotidyltransferase/poly(A) polymerase
MAMKKDILLTSEEQKVLDLLMEVVRAKSPSTTVRVVGGWVRDKLLGIKPKDLDLMVDNMTGPEFAQLVTSYFGLKAAHTIKVNPDKSKHVETAKLLLPVDGKVLEIDVAMCRKEVYGEKSRVPSQVVKATAAEDSLRRDLTVNAIFYNIATKQIEDFTGHGLEDLENKTLRAPGNPVVRFMEDPLRILRIARFAARYGWGVEDSTMKAMGDPEVMKMLEVKTAPERMGEELKKMMSEPYADKGLEILQSHGILDTMINRSVAGTEYENRISPFNMDQKSLYHDLSVWDHSISAVKNMMKKYPVEEPERRVVALLVALGHDIGKLFEGVRVTKDDGHVSYHGHEDFSRDILNRLLKHLKLDSIAPEVSFIASMHMRPYALVNASPKAIRKFLRQLSKAGVKWIDVINMVMSDVTAKTEMNDSVRSTLSELIDLKAKIAQVDSEMEGLGVVQNKPLLNGGEIMKAFGNNSPGPWIGTVMEYVEDLVDTDPTVSKETAVMKAKGQFPEFIKSAVLL